MSLVNFRIERADSTITVHVDGQVDLSCAGDLSATVWTASEREPSLETMWVDLTDVSFFDSAGVNALFTLNDDLGKAGRSLGVIAPQLCPARRVLDIVQLGQVMPLRETGPQHAE